MKNPHCEICGLKPATAFAIIPFNITPADYRPPFFTEAESIDDDSAESQEEHDSPFLAKGEWKFVCDCVVEVEGYNFLIQQFFQNQELWLTTIKTKRETNPDSFERMIDRFRRATENL